MNRNIDSSGRVSLPVEMRKKLNLEIGDPVDFLCEDDRIIITKHNKKTNNYLRMWEALKEYIHDNYLGENEIETIMEELENQYISSRDLIDSILIEIKK